MPPFFVASGYLMIAIEKVNKTSRISLLHLILHVTFNFAIKEFKKRIHKIFNIEL
jgi:hypothetical protein